MLEIYVKLTSRIINVIYVLNYWKFFSKYKYIRKGKKNEKTEENLTSIKKNKKQQ